MTSTMRNHGATIGACLGRLGGSNVESSFVAHRCLMGNQAVRWNIKVSKDTDLTLRAFLGPSGAKESDISNFVEDAVRWRLLQRTITDIQDRNADADPDEIQRIVNEAVTEVRAERRRKQKTVHS